MKFSKERFKKHAPIYLQKILSSHLDILDGKVVSFEDDEFGVIRAYKADDEKFYLYPVSKDWCVKNE